MSDRNQKPSLRKKLIFTTLIVIMTVCLLEMGLRIGGYIILKLNPPLIAMTDIEDKDESIILCMGDSFTFGIGTDYQHSYPRQLERILDEKHSQVRFRVYNLGIPGSNSSQLANNSLYYINKYNPDLLIVMTGRNDIWNFTDVNNPSLLNKLDSILNHVRVYKLAKIIRVNLRSKIESKMTNMAMAKANLVDTYNKENINIKKREIISPESSKQVEIGYNFVKQGRDDLAEECFLKALQLDPNNISAYRHLGRIYREQAKYELAEKCLREVLAQEEEPEDPSAYLELGMVHRVQNKYILAREELKKAMVDPNHIYLAFGELMQAYKDEEEFYKDVENFKREIKDKDVLARIDKLVKLRRDKESIYRILSRNLIRINEISKKNKIKIVIQTDPNIDEVAENIRKIAKEHRIPLVDNRLIFKEKLKSHDKKDFFVGDDHCNAEGYRIIAQNIYHTLIKEDIINELIDKR